MRFIVHCLTVTALLLPIACSSVATRSDQTFRDLIGKRLAAHSGGDAETYQAQLAEGFVHTDDTGKRRSLLEMRQFNGAPNRSKWTIGELHSRAISNDLEAVECEVIEHISFGPRVLDMPLQETDLFVLKDGRWRFLEHSETHKVASPSPIAVEADLLQEYVGQYEWWPGYVDTVSRLGDSLYVRSTGDDNDIQLKAATREAFFIEGDPALAIFVRDAQNKVAAEIIHFPDGQVVSARRIDRHADQ